MKRPDLADSGCRSRALTLGEITSAGITSSSLWSIALVRWRRSCSRGKHHFRLLTYFPRQLVHQLRCSPAPRKCASPGEALGKASMAALQWLGNALRNALLLQLSAHIMKTESSQTCTVGTINDDITHQHPVHDGRELAVQEVGQVAVAERQGRAGSRRQQGGKSAPGRAWLHPCV